MCRNCCVCISICVCTCDCQQKYVECADPPYFALAGQDGLGVVPELQTVLDSPAPDDIQVLLYSGQYDVICNHIGIKKFLSKLSWSGAAGWAASENSIWLSSGGGGNTAAGGGGGHGHGPAGYLKRFKNLIFLLVLDAGHMVPMNKPKEALDMILSLVSGSGSGAFKTTAVRLKPTVMKTYDNDTAACLDMLMISKQQHHRKTAKYA